MREIINLIEGGKLTPDAGVLNQQLLSVRSQRMNYAVATNTGSGTQNAITVSFDPPIGNSMTPGMPIRVKAAQNTTGACTLSVDGVIQPLKRCDGSALEDQD